MKRKAYQSPINWVRFINLILQKKSVSGIKLVFRFLKRSLYSIQIPFIQPPSTGKEIPVI